MSDLGYGLRLLRSNPGVTAAIVLTLALGIGANTAIFSVVHAVLLRQLPYRDPQRLVMLWERNPAMGMPIPGARIQVMPRNFVAWTERSRSFEQLAAFDETNYTLTGGVVPERVDAARATAGFFDLFGVAAARGRTFRSGDEQGARAAVLSDGFWKRRFGGDAAIVGRTLSLDGVTYTVTGVLPPQFHLPAMWEGMSQKRPDLWIPLDSRVTNQWGSLYVFGRLKPAVTVEQASAEMDSVGTILARENPQRAGKWSVSVFPVRVEDISPAVRRSLLVLMAAVAFVLLIACANIANLLLARAAARRPEIAIRAALGASTARLLRQFLTESLLLALLGGAAGVLIAVWGLDLLKTLRPSEIHRLETIRIDLPVLLAATLLSVLTGLLFGLAPAFSGLRGIRGAGRSVTGGGGRGVLIAAQVALSLMLLVAAGLMMKSLGRALAVDVGLQADNLLTMSVSLPRERYSQPHQISGFYRRLLDDIRALPGVESASAVNGLPMTSIFQTFFAIEGRPPRDPLSADVRVAASGYFTALGTPIVRGRDFEPRDVDAGQALIVNESFARLFFPNEDALGRSLNLMDGKNRRIVGIARDIRQLGPEAESRPEIVVPSIQMGQMVLMLRSRSGPKQFTAAVRAAVAKLDPQLAVSDEMAMSEVLGDWHSQRRFNVALLGVFSGVALLLAAIGVYSVASYSAAMRHREIGIRMALGARHGDVLRLVLMQSTMAVAAGVALGLVGSLALGRVIASVLFRVSPADTATLALAPCVLLAAAIAAAWLPARRAARVDPAAALRYE